MIFAIECAKCLLQKKGGKIIVINSSISWKSKLDSIYKEENNNNNNLNKKMKKMIFLLK